MALNQVIHGSNRVVENPNRYKLNPVAGQANTYDFEKQPGVITDNGTPYNKLILDKIDNVLSYLIPSVEKVGESIEIVTGNILPTTWSSLGNHKYKGTTTIGEDVFIETNSELLSDNILPSAFDGGTGSFYTPNSAYGVSDVTENYVIIEFENAKKILSFNIACNNTGGSTNYKSTCYIQGSNDKTNWDNLASFENQFSTLETITLNNPNYYKYYRVYRDRISDVPNFRLKLFELNINQVIITQTTYQNQFTLDNNGTPIKEIVPVEKTQIENNLFAQNITPSWSVSSSAIYSIGNSIDLILKSFTKENTTIIPSVNITTTSSGFETGGQYSTNNKVKVQSSNGSAYESSSAKFLSNFNNTENDYTNKENLFWILSGDEINIKFDMKDIFDIKFKYRIYFSNVNAKWQGSNDGTNWVDIETIQDNVDSFLISNQYRYYNINAVATSNGYFAISYLYLNELKFNYIDYEEHYIYMPFTNNQRVIVETPSTLDLDGVESNTLNGIDIPTLLQPSTKYELIYNDSASKFEIGGKPLFDITLTEAVNQVDLTGIYDKLLPDKSYLLCIKGKSSSDTSLDFGDTFGGYLYSYDSAVYILFTKITSGKIYGAVYPSSSSNGIGRIYNILQGYEYIKCRNNASYTFSVGTRIIIKEVA